MDKDNTDKEKVLNLISHLNINVNEEEQVNKLITAFEQSTSNLSYTRNFTDIVDSNIIINKLVEQLKKLIGKQLHLKKRKARTNSPITQDEFEQLFKSKTEKYLRKKEKSFADPSQFKEFLQSEAYEKINMTRRKQMLERYTIIDSTTS